MNGNRWFGGVSCGVDGAGGVGSRSFSAKSLSWKAGCGAEDALRMAPPKVEEKRGVGVLAAISRTGIANLAWVVLLSSSFVVDVFQPAAEVGLTVLRTCVGGVILAPCKTSRASFMRSASSLAMSDVDDASDAGGTGFLGG